MHEIYKHRLNRQQQIIFQGIQKQNQWNGKLERNTEKRKKLICIFRKFKDKKLNEKIITQ